jgi:hypothetical protein
MEIENIDELGPTAAADWRGGVGLFSVTGTLDGFVARLEHSTDGGVTFIESMPRNPDRMLQDGRESILARLPSGKVRLRVLNAGGDTDVTLTGVIAQSAPVVGVGVDQLVVLTQAEYDALDPVDDRTAYWIREDDV